MVELEHRHLDRLAGGDAIRGMIVGGDGWTAILELFAKAAQQGLGDGGPSPGGRAAAALVGCGS